APRAALPQNEEVFLALETQAIRTPAVATPRRRHFLGLSVILSPFTRAKWEQERRHVLRCQVDRSVRASIVPGEREHVVEIAEPDRLQVVETAHPRARLHHVCGHSR